MQFTEYVPEFNVMQLGIQVRYFRSNLLPPSSWYPELGAANFSEMLVHVSQNTRRHNTVGTCLSNTRRHNTVGTYLSNTRRHNTVGTCLSNYTASQTVGTCLSNTRRHNTEHPHLQNVIYPQVFVSIANKGVGTGRRMIIK